MLVRYRSVLAVPGSPRLYVTAVLARLPQGMSSLTILLLVRAATHSYALSGLAVGGEALASAVAGPPQGRLVDRLGRARVLLPCAVAQASLFIALVLAVHADLAGLVLVAVACGIGAVQPAIAPVVRALLRTVVSDELLRESAYSLESVVQELIWICGPLLVAIVVATTSASGAALLCAGVGLVGTTWFVSSPIARDQTRPDRPAHRGSLWAVPALRVLPVPVALMGISLGALEVGLPSLALHAGSRASAGALLALWSVGSMIGGLFYGARRWRVSLAQRYRRLLAAAVVCSVPLILARTIPEGIVGALLAGLTIAPAFACQYALVGRAVPAGVETEAFTWVGAALVVGIAAGSAIGGALIGGLGVSAPFELSCASLAVAAATSRRTRRAVAVAA